MVLHVEDPIATLRLAAKGLDPDVVTRIMERKPEVAAKMGDRLYKTAHSRAFARTGTWFLSTKNVPVSSPSSHLGYLFDLLHQHVDELRDLMPDLEINFTLLVFGKNKDANIDAIEREIKKIGTLDIEVQDLQSA